jgi:hypothetical protein
MPLFNNQLTWQGIGATVALILVALAFAVIGYAEWSSEAAFDQFLNASKPSLSDPNQSGEKPISPQGRTSCYPSKGSRTAAQGLPILARGRPIPGVHRRPGAQNPKNPPTQPAGACRLRCAYNRRRMKSHRHVTSCLTARSPRAARSRRCIARPFRVASLRWREAGLEHRSSSCPGCRFQLRGRSKAARRWAGCGRKQRDKRRAVLINAER